VADLRAFGDPSRAEIPVERIAGPILLLAGKDDQIWPSYPMAQRITARLKARGHPYADQLVAYDQVGHPIPYAYIPLAGDRQHARFDVGGTPAGAARAQADAWPKILAFLAAAARAAGT
jgi:dienelactone hydrolase